MTHDRHPLIEAAGLADGCDRCEEIAADPFVGLDDDNLQLLAARTREWMKDQQFPRSANETTAMRHMERAIVRCRRLKRIGGVA